MTAGALDSFHPAIRRWFADTYPEPTDVQTSSWPAIARGDHTLITAPTGSGKTLTAFLWSLNRFACDRPPDGTTRVLYVSPLKALNNDIHRNLLDPLRALEHGYGFPAVRVLTRSGDTASSERQKMLRRPPDILITTPESLSLLLTTVRGRQALGHVDTVILDEIHAIADNRRGVVLMTSVERLARLAGEFQRIALSATVRPLDAIAQYVAGRTSDGQTRPIALIESRDSKTVEITVRFPEAARTAAENGQKIWDPLADSFRDIIDSNRATLFFTNSRRLAEKITHKINERAPAPLAYAHHGSLAREVRTAVEARLKSGDLRAIVATNSLEMGIDIGSLDEVVLVQSPPTIAATVQRVGRAGHHVGAISRGSLFPTHPGDFLEAAVLCNAVANRDIEPLTPMKNPLDALAQIIVSMTATETWRLDDLYGLLRTSAPYADLHREHFDLVIEMLAGRYAGSRVRNLAARLDVDRLDGTVRAHRSAVFAYYNSGGTIPDRGYYQLKHADSGAAIGELDEEFVWEATVGQVLTLGAQNWQITRITHNDVIVRPAKSTRTAPPFWRAETQNRSFHFSLAIGVFLREAEAHLAAGRKTQLVEELHKRGFDTEAADELVDYLARQRAHTSGRLPHRQHLLMELIHTGPAGYRGSDGGRMLVLHTFWGGRVNRPLALAMIAAWRDRFPSVPEIFADDNCIALQLKQALAPDEVLGLVSGASLDEQLRRSLESSGLFGARFRECAGRALLLTRQRFNQRMPLWMTRLQAKKLMSAIAKYPDFPVLLETWRTCLNDEFDLPATRRVLDELESGEIEWSWTESSSPSPFAASIAFDQVSQYMYADDTPERDAPSGLDDDLIRRAVWSEDIRPQLRPGIVEEFVAKRQRRAPGYEPQDAAAWSAWIKERILLPEAEWPEQPIEDMAVPRVVTIASGPRRWLVHEENLHALVRSNLVLATPAPAEPVDDPRDAAQLASEILSYYGPLTPAEIARLLPAIPDGLIDDCDTLVSGMLVAGDEAERYCDAENLESLLRFQRAADRPRLDPLPGSRLPGFLALWQGFGTACDDDAAIDVLERLRAYSAPVALWLGELLRARLVGFEDTHLDRWFGDFGLSWQGSGRETVRVGYAEDLTLVAGPSDTADEPWPLTALFRDPTARYDFLQLADAADMGLTDFNAAWWQGVWAGRVLADGLAALRAGVRQGYELAGLPGSATRNSHRRRNWRAPAGWPGAWRLAPDDVPSTDPPADTIDELEANKDRARLLLDRYGVVCRELANREGGLLRWRQVFRALTIMELAGEVVAGYFFTGLSGPQFALPRAVNLLTRGFDAPERFWCSALDPAAPTGLGLDIDGLSLPDRRAGNRLAYLGGELALVIEAGGRRLHFNVSPDAPAIDAAIEALVDLALERRRITVVRINGEPAEASPYLVPISRHLKRVHDHKHIYFEATA